MKQSSKWLTLNAPQNMDNHTTETYKQNSANSNASPYKPSPVPYSKHAYNQLLEMSFTPKPSKTFLDRSSHRPQKASGSINVTPDKQVKRKQRSFILPNHSRPDLTTTIKRPINDRQQVFKTKDLNSPFGNAVKCSLRQTFSNTSSLQYQIRSYLAKPPICDEMVFKKKVDYEYDGKHQWNSTFTTRQNSRKNSKMIDKTSVQASAFSARPQNMSKTPTKISRVSQDTLISSITPKQRNNINMTDPSGSYFQTTQPKGSNTAKTTQLRITDFKLGACKGEGRFGKVFPAIHKKSGFLLAIKKVAKEAVRIIIDQFVQEIKISLFVNHPNIIRIYGFFCDSENIYIMMEYMEQGSLYGQAKLAKKFRQDEAAVKLLQVCEAVSYLHSLDILHRDIKPQNIVLSNGVCKLCDFGWAAYSRERRKTYCGTLDYGESYDNYVDIWAIGVLAYELLVGKAPFYHISRKETMKNIMNCDFSIPNEVSASAKFFITKAIQKSAGQRYNIQSLLKDRFLTQVKRQL